VNQDTYSKALRHFGHNAQVLKAVEELAELQVELMHHLGDRGDISRICSEVADVWIMVHQLRIMFGAQKVDGFIHSKVNRLEERMAS